MHLSGRLSDVLKRGGFAAHARIGKLLDISFLGQCCLASAIVASALFAGSWLDHTLILPGRNVGLLEHPGIWVFLGLQIGLPLSIHHSLAGLLRSRARIKEITDPPLNARSAVGAPVREFLELQSNESKAIAALFYCIGIAAFAWNTYQDQLPGVVVPFDFWDSSHHLFGFWLTRAYKLYLFGWLLPYIALVHIAVIVTVLRIVRHGRVAGSLKLIPFDADGVGGLGFVPRLVMTPIAVTLLMSSLSMAAAFEVHRALDVTPLIGVFVLLASTTLAYIVPILFLRTDIVMLKKDLLRTLRRQQQAYYNGIAERQGRGVDSLQRGNEAIEYFDRVCARVQAISNYPHFKRLIGYSGLALTPSFLAFALKVLTDVGPLLRRH